MENKNNIPERTKENLSYSVRLYRPNGSLAQKFIHASKEQLSPGNVIEMPKGIYKGKYKLAAVGVKECTANHDPEDERMIEESKRALLHFPMGCAMKVKNDYNIYKDIKEEGTRTTIFAYPTRYQEPIQDAYVSSCGWLLNYDPEIRRSQAHNEQVTEFRGDFIKKGLASKVVDKVAGGLCINRKDDPNTKGMRSLAKKAIGIGLVG